MAPPIHNLPGDHDVYAALAELQRACAEMRAGQERIERKIGCIDEMLRGDGDSPGLLERQRTLESLVGHMRQEREKRDEEFRGVRVQVASSLVVSLIVGLVMLAVAAMRLLPAATHP